MSPRVEFIPAKVAAGVDVSDADAAVGEVLSPKTFYSVAPPRKTGVMATVALDPTSSAYPAGYHVGDVGGLPAVDADLASANIKSGATIFNVAGAATVQEIGAANAAVTDVKDPKTFFSVTGAIKTGTMPTVAIGATNDIYAAGYHAGNAGGLDAIDTDLASANIKSGITIFGKAGAATVQEIGAADAAVTDVKDPKTFFSVTGAIKTGTIATVAIAADNSAYPAGYHAGAASLAAIDADLATANILSGKNIFGFTGPATVQDIAVGDLVVAEAPTGKKFFAVTGTVKTGTGTKTLNPANDTVAAGYYAATTLSAVDADLAKANIKYGKTIFGIFGTYGANLISSDYYVVSIFIHSGITSTITTSFSSPGAGPSGLAYDGANLISSDLTNDSVYIHSGITSTITTSFSSPGTYPYGLAYDGANLISSDNVTASIFIHSGITSTITTSFSSPGTNLFGLAYADANLISCDFNNDSIYIHSGITSTITTSFSSPGTNPYGLAYTGANLISSDGGTASIYIHSGVTSTITTSFSCPSGSPYGLTLYAL